MKLQALLLLLSPHAIAPVAPVAPVAAVAALRPHTGSELPQLEMHPVELERADGSTRTAYRGMLRVSVVRARPDSKPIGVDVWRFPAADADAVTRPPLFRLHGGPGWPGLEPQDIDWDDDVAPMIAHGDLVIVGQRGIGTSEPNTSCAEFAEEVDTKLPKERQEELLRAQCTACREHWEAQGYDLSGFNVIEAAADVDDVRRLLGYDQIVLMGGSFGSHWAMTVMRYHPEIVARALLNGMEGPDHTYDSPAGVLAALERIAAEAEASDELSGKLPEIGLIEALLQVILSVEEEPLDVEVAGKPVPITADEVRDNALGYTRSVGSRRTVGGWPADVMRLVEGNFTPLGQTLAMRRLRPARLPTASFFALDCGSGITRERHERYTNDPAVQIVGDLGALYDAACPAWGVDLGDGFRSGFTTSIPTVIVHGTWDTSTPFENALELVPYFEDLRFVRVEGGTHGALFEAIRHDAAFGDAVKAFIDTGAKDGLPEEIVLPPIEWQSSW